MENLIQRFENLKNLLTQRASTALGEALLNAFLSSLSDYETAIVKNLTAAGKEIAGLREENDLLRSLIGIKDPGVLAKIISQGEEIRFQREQILALKKELAENRQAQDRQLLEIKALESDLEKVHQLREEEQSRFRESLDAVKEQLKTLSEKTSEKQQGLNREKEELARKYADHARETYLRAEDELRSVAVKLRALAAEAKSAAEAYRSSLDNAAEQMPDLPPVRPPKKGFGFGKKAPAPLAPPPPNPFPALARELAPVTEAVREFDRLVENCLKMLDWGAPEYAKVSWSRFLNELKNRLSAVPRRQGVRINWPNDKLLPPFICDERMVAGIGEALVRNALEAIPEEGVVDVSVQVTPGYLVLQVLDNGQGINPRDMDKIFLPFYTTKDGHEGIGLARALKLTRALGGTLTCEPKGIGALFTLRVPGQTPAAVKTPPRAVQR